MQLIQQLFADMRNAVEWQGRLLRERVLRLAWGVAFAFLAVALGFASLALVLGAVYLEVAAAGGTLTGLLAVAALALLCALGAGLAARGLCER